jgi:hypothetical protein
MRRNVRHALQKAKDDGRPLAVWRSGRVVYLQGDEIELEPADSREDSIDIRDT